MGKKARNTLSGGGGEGVRKELKGGGKTGGWGVEDVISLNKLGKYCQYVHPFFQ